MLSIKRKETSIVKKWNWANGTIDWWIRKKYSMQIGEASEVTEVSKASNVSEFSRVGKVKRVSKVSKVSQVIED